MRIVVAMLLGAWGLGVFTALVLVATELGFDAQAAGGLHIDQSAVVGIIAVATLLGGLIGAAIGAAAGATRR